MVFVTTVMCGIDEQTNYGSIHFTVADKCSG